SRPLPAPGPSSAGGGGGSSCGGPPRRLHVLPCLHAFCRQCLEAQRHPGAGDALKLRCPICDQKVVISEPSGMDALPSSNFLLSNLLDVVVVAAGNTNVFSSVLHFYCDTCSVPICRECTMGRHVGHSFIYLQDALQDSRTLTIQKVGTPPLAQLQYLTALEKGQSPVVKNVFKNSLIHHCRIKYGLYGPLSFTCEGKNAVQQVLEEGRTMDILLARDRMLAQVQELKNVRGLLQPQEDDRIMFTPPDQALYMAIKSMGFVSSGAFAPLTKATGEGLKRALQGKVASFTVIGYDHDGEPRLSGGDMISAVVMGPDGNLFGADVSDQQNGTYLVSYRPQMEGEHLVSVMMCNQHIENSPFKVMVKSGRSYIGIGLPGLSFGSEGDSDGKLSCKVKFYLPHCPPFPPLFFLPLPLPTYSQFRKFYLSPGWGFMHKHVLLCTLGDLCGEFCRLSQKGSI
uniref:RING-type E3 ubiquitin transferase n=1 Tax=Dromaius novaehollandiae TaxID=8790 RepID=A0A8C4JLH6_DRONO